MFGVKLTMRVTVSRPDDFDYEATELFDVVQSWILRRTNIRPVSHLRSSGKRVRCRFWV